LQRKQRKLLVIQKFCIGFEATAVFIKICGSLGVVVQLPGSQLRALSDAGRLSQISRQPGCGDQSQPEKTQTGSQRKIEYGSGYQYRKRRPATVEPVFEDDAEANGYNPEEVSVVQEPRALYKLQPHTREKLDEFIDDYNVMFGSAYSTKDSESFYNYYNDVSKRVKEGQIDILLVVNMFLAGFDSKTLNTLYVDKNLKYHGLIQAYSRTNRILNEQKSQGNVVVFRNLKHRTDEAITLFRKYWDKEQKMAFEKIISEEKLSKEKTEKLIEDYLFAEESHCVMIYWI